MDQLTFAQVPAEAVKLTKAAGPILTQLICNWPQDTEPASIWLQPYTSKLVCSQELKLAGLDVDVMSEPPPDDEPWVNLKRAVLTSTVFGPVADVTGWKEGPINSLWGGPRPLANALAGGALGAGAGYGAGWLAESLFPEQLKKRRLRRFLGLVGGAVGALPGIYHGIDNWSQGRTVLDTWPPPPKQGSVLDEAERLVGELVADKSAQFPGQVPPDFQPFIDAQRLQGDMWADPMLAPRTAAAASGLLAGASEARGGSNLISPFDIARIAVGMGSGLASGMFVGKTLGALAGLSEPAQKSLRQAGVFAGVLTSVVPMAFGAKERRS